MRLADRLVPISQEWIAVHDVVDASHLALAPVAVYEVIAPQPVQRLSRLVARRVRHLRLLRRWTVDRLADESGLDVKQVIELECGQAQLHIVPAVESALGAPVLPSVNR